MPLSPTAATHGMMCLVSSLQSCHHFEALSIPSGVVVNRSILSLLLAGVATRRPAMRRSSRASAAWHPCWSVPCCPSSARACDSRCAAAAERSSPTRWASAKPCRPSRSRPAIRYLSKGTLAAVSAFAHSKSAKPWVLLQNSPVSEQFM